MLVDAYYIHSWMSWAVCNLIIESSKSDINPLFITGRNFQIPIKNKYIEFRFEEYEYLIQVNQNINYLETLDSLLKEKSGGIIENIYIPHIGYKPFHLLCSCNCIKKINFYQEGIELPHGITIRREANMLLTNNNHGGSLFTSDKQTTSSKISGVYYSIQKRQLPLHLNGQKIGSIREAIEKYMPENDLPKIDFALIAGKMTNSHEGLILFKSILAILKRINNEFTILLKASPSSTPYINQWMNNQAIEDLNIYYEGGNSSIEKMIVKSRINVLISEMFSLPCIALETRNSNTKVVSIEKTIVKDFPALKNALSERYNYEAYKDLVNSQYSLSEILKNQGFLAKAEK